jgi:hypothetical protein
MPNLSSSTFASGARQFVVQEALETMRSVGFSVSSFTPITTIASIASFGGTVRTTRFAPASMCFWQSSRRVKMPVASTAKSTLFCLCGRFAGSRSAVIWILLPSTAIQSLPAFTLPAKRPWTVSYFRRCASVAGSVMSLIDTTSMSLRAWTMRKTLRPIRPKPLIAIRMAIGVLFSWRKTEGATAPTTCLRRKNGGRRSGRSRVGSEAGEPPSARWRASPRAGRAA